MEITGYRQLSDEEKAMVNEIKEMGSSLGGYLNHLESYPVDKRWLAIAKTDLQKGFMALVRSVTKPEGF